MGDIFGGGEWERGDGRKGGRGGRIEGRRIKGKGNGEGREGKGGAADKEEEQEDKWRLPVKKTTSGGQNLKNWDLQVQPQNRILFINCDPHVLENWISLSDITGESDPVKEERF